MCIIIIFKYMYMYVEVLTFHRLVCEYTILVSHQYEHPIILHMWLWRLTWFASLSSAKLLYWGCLCVCLCVCVYVCPSVRDDLKVAWHFNSQYIAIQHYMRVDTPGGIVAIEIVHSPSILEQLHLTTLFPQFFEMQ